MSDKFDCNGSTSSDFLSMYTSESYHSPTYQGHASEINFTPSPQKSSAHSRLDMNGYSQESVVNVNGNVFCCQDNVDECIGFLNQELTSIGLPSLYDASSDRHDTSRLVNSTYDLLQKYGHATRVREEVENRVHRQEADLAHLREAQRSLVRQLDQSQQETVQSQERERQLANKNKTLSTKLKAERDEVKRLQSMMQHRDAQFKHEVKKKERELTKLKERVHHMLSDKKGSKMAMDISSVVARPSGKRGQWTATSKQGEELYREVISNFEEKQKELLVENTGLRQCLQDLQKEMIKAFRESPPGSADSSPVLKLDEAVELEEDEDRDNSSQEGLDGQFEMPFEYLEENSIKTVKEKCRQLRRYIQLIEKKQAVVEKSPMKAESKQKQGEMEKLKRDVQRYKAIIDEQDLYIQRTMGEGCSEPDGKSFLNESDLEKEKEHLEFQKDLFTEQKSNFEKERKTYNEATLRLHKDKQHFEQEKLYLMQKEFSAITPFQRRSQGVSVHRHPVKRTLPTTPSVQITRDISQHALRTPDCSKPSMGTPTTRELYRHLQLISEEDDPTSLRPRSADTADPLRGSRSSYAPSPAWANSGRRRPSSAVAKTSPSGDSAWTSHTSDSAPYHMSDHMDNIKMMLFAQQQSQSQTSKDDSA